MKSRCTIEITVDDNDVVHADVTQDPDVDPGTPLVEAPKAAQFAWIATKAVEQVGKSQCMQCAIDQLSHLHVAADTAHEFKKDVAERVGEDVFEKPTHH